MSAREVDSSQGVNAVTQGGGVDPVTAEIVRESLVAITDEMKTNLMRTAYNPVIYEALDYTVGIFDRFGNTASIGLGLPMFIRGLADVIKSELSYYGTDGMEPGDILLTNDAYTTGSHLNHIVLTVPIFWGGEVVAFSATMAHWQDVGGALSGTTRDIYSEGIQLPFVKVFKKGVPDDEILRIISSNVRVPERAMGDLDAEVAAVRTGERRFLELLEKYGLEGVDGSMQHLASVSREAAYKAVAEMPDGVYHAEAFMDDDGVSREPIPIRVSVEIADSEMIVDLTQVSEQVSGYFNSGETAGRSAAQVAFKCLTTPTLRPINDGSFAPLRVVLPPGRVISATKPAAMRRWMTIPMTVVDTIFKALGPAVPTKVMAGHHADLLSHWIYGTDPRTNRFYVQGAGVLGGGWGAKHNADGASATVCINDGDTHNSPVEATEAKLPLRIDSLRLRPDSGGAGRHRGGLGVERRMRMCAPARINTYAERTQCRPWGYDGGGEALANNVSVERGDGTYINSGNGKLDAVEMGTDDVLVIQSGGGGGYGDPLDRPEITVASDVRAGYVSPLAARSEYGVVVADDGSVDGPATADLRRTLREAR